MYVLVNHLQYNFFLLINWEARDATQIDSQHDLIFVFVRLKV
jgi:hypothetical protein